MTELTHLPIREVRDLLRQAVRRIVTDQVRGQIRARLRRVAPLVVVAGANGSGKTTLLKHFNGLLLPVSGRVLVDGRETHRATEAVRRMVGMVFQHADAQIVGETVYDDVAFGPENLRLPRETVHRCVLEALAAVGREPG